MVVRKSVSQRRAELHTCRPHGRSGHPHRHQQVQEARCARRTGPPPASARRPSRARPRRPASPRCPASRYSGLNATVSSAPSYLASSVLVRLTDVLGDGQRARGRRARMPSRTGVASRASSFTRRTRLEQRLAADRQAVGMALTGSGPGSSGSRPRSAAWSAAPSPTSKVASRSPRRSVTSRSRPAAA